MNALKKALRVSESGSWRHSTSSNMENSQSDLTNLYRDDELIDVLDSGGQNRTRLALVDESESHQSPIKHDHHLIEDIASSESTSLLDESSDDESPTSAHCHITQPPAAELSRRAKWQLSCAFVLCLCFMIAEMIGAYLSNSTAIYSDAAHMLTDLTGFGLSIAAIFVSEKTATKRHPFGFFRAEILGAVVSVLLIWVVTGVLVYTSIQRIQTNDFDIKEKYMILVSALGVVMNGVMAVILHGSLPCLPKMPHSHGHSHGHDHTNINVRAAMVHVFGDLLQSVGVLIAAFLINHDPSYKIADPICTFIFSALVLCTTFGIIRDALAILMESFPSKLDYTTIRVALQSIANVQHVHSLRAWNLSMNRIVLSVHLGVSGDGDREKILRMAQRILRRRFKITDTTIQIETYDSVSTALCDACQL